MQSSDFFKAQVAQAYAGSRTYNPHQWESMSYVTWNHFLLSFLPPEAQANVYVGPQFAISKDQVTNDGENKTSTRIPDFVLLYLKAMKATPGPRNPSDVMTYEDLERHYCGQYKILDSAILALVEVKAFPRVPKGLRPGKELSDAVETQYMARFEEAVYSSKGQLSIFFAAHPEASGVVAIACVSLRFQWINCGRDMADRFSDYVDPRFRTPKTKNRQDTGPRYQRPDETPEHPAAPATGVRNLRSKFSVRDAANKIGKAVAADNATDRFGNIIYPQSSDSLPPKRNFAGQRTTTTQTRHVAHSAQGASHQTTTSAQPEASAIKIASTRKALADSESKRKVIRNTATIAFGTTVHPKPASGRANTPTQHPVPVARTVAAVAANPSTPVRAAPTGPMDKGKARAVPAAPAARKEHLLDSGGAHGGRKIQAPVFSSAPSRPDESEVLKMLGELTLEPTEVPGPAAPAGRANDALEVLPEVAEEPSSGPGAAMSADHSESEESAQESPEESAQESEDDTLKWSEVVDLDDVEAWDRARYGILDCIRHWNPNAAI